MVRPLNQLLLIRTGLLALVVLLGPAALAHAQVPSCPLVSDVVASQALGTPVQGSLQSDLPGGVTLCDFIDPSGIDYGVSRQSGAFPPGAVGGAAALAVMYIPQLPPEARAQIEALSQAGLNVAVPGYEVSTVGDVGDAALFVKSELVPGFFKDSLIVQRGSDGFSFDTDDTPDAQTRLTALAQATLGSPQLAADVEVIFHVTTAVDWQAAERSGAYTLSTRGRTLEQEGFIRCSTASQVEHVANAYYTGVNGLVLLVVDDAVIAALPLEPISEGRFVLPQAAARYL